MSKFLSRKFILCILGFGALLSIAIVWLAKDTKDVALWGLWFGGLAAIQGVYSGSNVWQKKNGE